MARVLNCYVCGNPAKLYQHGAWCDDHPPGPPKPLGYCVPPRCYCATPTCERPSSLTERR